MTTDCGNHEEQKRHKVYRRLFAAFLLLVILVLLVVLIVWLVLRPTKPKFYLQDASVAQFNLSSGDGTLTAVLQVTLASRNPNDRIGVYYDRVDAFALYKAQQVTATTALPPGYQGHNDVTVWTRTPATSSSTSASSAASGGRSAPGSPAITTSRSTAPSSLPSTAAGPTAATHPRPTSASST
ncbi:Late embryogenesis abundant protein [Musa troglodytarum]|uniref:Late embryogenesis abundant protein n=1 Tax=Musa troglodytarum TaxID=320322 RepID=A0A9E7L3N1_9LILI|nr:Late embryogenesis abundant protein [Musa troglodytarum]